MTTTHYRTAPNGKTYARVEYPGYGFSDSEYEVSESERNQPQLEAPSKKSPETYYRTDGNGKTWARVKYPGYGWSDSEYEVADPEQAKLQSAYQKASRGSSLSSASKATSLSSASASSTKWQSNALDWRRSDDSTISLGIDIGHDELKITKDGQSQTYRTANSSRTGIDPRGVAAKVGVRDAKTKVQIKYKGPREAVDLLLRSDTERFSSQLEHLPLALSHGQAVLDGHRRGSGPIYGIRNRSRPDMARKNTNESLNTLQIQPEGEYMRRKAKLRTFNGNMLTHKPFSMTQQINLNSTDHPEVYLERLSGNGTAFTVETQLKRVHRDKGRGARMLANAKAVGLKTGKDESTSGIVRKVGAPAKSADKLVSEMPAARKKFLRKAGLVDADDPKHSRSVFHDT